MRPSGLVAIAGVWMVACFAMLLLSFPSVHHNGSNEPHIQSYGQQLVRPLENRSVNRSSMDNSSLLFIHIPKAGGTTFTTILRELQCLQNPKKHSDCCRNPGSCYIKVYRRCISILGCVSHYPRSHLISQVKYSVAIFREPVARTVSGWFYFGHNPNSDAFEVRAEFEDVRRGARPRVTFEQYAAYPEYRNIQTRMLGAHSFPYRNVTVNDQVLERAKDAVDRVFSVALQEELVVSGMLLARRMGHQSAALDARIRALPLERANGRDIAVSANSSSQAATLQQSVPVFRGDANRGKSANDFSPEARQRILGDAGLVRRLRELNRHDVLLYQHAVGVFCRQVAAFPDLLAQLTAMRCADP